MESLIIYYICLNYFYFELSRHLVNDIRHTNTPFIALDVLSIAIDSRVML